ncbi:NTP transferase domain-containing protein [bacterium]|jgi:bifunctional UDP-N-acetylglucosamine pyrophosphorylase / glucosamine-1-phosphate N-acetyltransferase|nr:NTP transferase domain-containing protein [bacterium]
MSLIGVVLAAGKGTRMKSSVPKVLHPVCGKPMVHHVVDSLGKISADQIYIVVGFGGDSIKDSFSNDKLTFVEQKEQLGTGHAVLQASNKFNNDTSDVVLVLAGDCPLISPNTLNSLVHYHNNSGAKATVLTANLEDPAKYGRIIRASDGELLGIREAKDCSPEDLLVKEINTGVFCFDKTFLVDGLAELGTNNTQGEYYLTDIIHILKKKNERVEAFCLHDFTEVLGANTRQDLAVLNAIGFDKKNQEIMLSGVSIIDPKSTFIDQDVYIGEDTVIHPFSVIKGHSVVGKHCIIESHTVLTDVNLEDHTVVPAFENCSPIGNIG